MKNILLQSFIDACDTCADTCETCAAHNQGKNEMDNAVKLCLECADACYNLVSAINMDTNLDAFSKKCEDACNACASELEKHSNIEHGTECIDACRKCAEECKSMYEIIKSVTTRAYDFYNEPLSPGLTMPQSSIF